MRFEVANLLVQVIETFLANEENTEQYKNMRVLLSQLFAGIFEILQNKWTNSRDLNVRLLSFKLMGLIIHLSPLKKPPSQQEATLHVFINAMKKENFDGYLKILEVLI